ncbi:hypothetical protein [Chryseobacterium sp. PMSZPI]|uniref:hypothetical protein n=1 Tax=Chryseobacterium sp. PMSZPI TaxID=1033900 RepID=UPI001054917C|nr:hypothetical protein [Chryseobacterium sp. PMSZPI]
MNYQQAIQHKKEILKNTNELITVPYFEILIVPSKAEDFERFMKYYKLFPKEFNDNTCTKFSTDNAYMVYRFCEDNALNFREGKI